MAVWQKNDPRRIEFAFDTGGMLTAVVHLTMKQAGQLDLNDPAKLVVEDQPGVTFSGKISRYAKSYSAELARLLRLDPTIELTLADDKVLPIDLVDKNAEVHDLIGQAMAIHPEIMKRAALVEAACFRENQEHWRPWLPNVQVGASAGSFGGGQSSDYDNAGGRGDVDVLAVWELQNMGYGTVAARRKRNSQFAQADLELEKIRDRVKSDVVAALADVKSYGRQIAFAQQGITAATSSLKLNSDRIREGEGLPIEVIQSIRALARARDDDTKAVAKYNAAQYRLLNATGQPPAQQ